MAASTEVEVVTPPRAVPRPGHTFCSEILDKEVISKCASFDEEEDAGTAVAFDQVANGRMLPFGNIEIL